MDLPSPDSRYGFDENGKPLSKSQYDERYVNPDGSTRYPGNAGATPGSIVGYDDYDAFISNYGPHLDRIGYPGGEYLSVQPNGAAPSFAERSLPIESMGKEYHQYNFSGTLEPGWRIEVSEVAPAFGQPGGAKQVRFYNEQGVIVPINRLPEGMLVRI